MLVPSLLFLVAIAYANEDEDLAPSSGVIVMEIPDYASEILGRSVGSGAKRAVMPASGGIYGKRAVNAFLRRSLRQTSKYALLRRSVGLSFSPHYENRYIDLPGMYGKRSEVLDDFYDERQELPLSAGWQEKRAVMPFSGGLYGKRAAVMPFSGGLYGKRVAMPFSGGLYGKRSDRFIRSPMPISGGFFG
ncbi:hypothetical protein COOONC_07089 [Cooperia oncophora]